MMKATEKYSCSFFKEYGYAGDFDSIEDAFADIIDQAKSENKYLDDDTKIETVYAGQVMEFVPRVAAGCVIESLQETADDIAGEAACDYLEGVSKEEVKLLEEMLTETFNQWAEKTNNSPSFYMVVNIEERKVY